MTREDAEKLTTKVLLTSMSPMAAETTTFPIDITKTRLQLHGEALSSARPASAFGVVAEIVRREGPLGLYKGLSPAIIRHLFYTPIRIVGYEYLRNTFVPGDQPLSLPSKALIGGVSGVIAQLMFDMVRKITPVIQLRDPPFYGASLVTSSVAKESYASEQVVASPADLVKVRMQADGRMVSQGLQPRYSGPANALNKILQTEGLRGLWKGVFPNIQRAFLVNMGELACYDHAKRFIIQHELAGDNIYAHTLASITSGLAATALSCPADVVKTRMMNQTVGEDGKVKYRNSFDCLRKSVRVEGVRALWKGFFPTWARLGPWQFVFWVSYEKFRHIAGLSSF